MGSGVEVGDGGEVGSAGSSKREKEGERKERDIRRVAVVLSNQWMLFFIQLFERPFLMSIFISDKYKGCLLLPHPAFLIFERLVIFYQLNSQTFHHEVILHCLIFIKSCHTHNIPQSRCNRA